MRPKHSVLCRGCLSHTDVRRRHLRRAHCCFDFRRWKILNVGKKKMHELYWDVQSEVRPNCYPKSTTWLYARSRLHQCSSTLNILKSSTGLSQSCARQIIRILSMVVVVLRSCNCSAAASISFERKEALTPFISVHHVIIQYIAACHVCFWQTCLITIIFHVWICGRIQCGCESCKTQSKAVQDACADTCRIEEHLSDTITTSSWDEQRLTAHDRLNPTSWAWSAGIYTHIQAYTEMW